ncbi:clathrin light chain B-like isoform X2 [Limulus polyphemus]|uniref:Clathrin light chain n=1 Tax=Limulus polyphemus TaxID=6850 RepID=A0ABM1BR92_LIMPO|nr:clathrin light chain B-like isoform X2 [Limulus polyphemus]
MSGFDAFESDFNNESLPEEDPVAEFYAREQNELAGLEDDLNFESPAKSQTDSHSQQATADYENNFMGDGEADMFTFSEESQPIEMNGPSESAFPLNSAYQTKSVIQEEPEKIRKWREEHQKMLKEKDEQESLKKEEMHQTALKEIEEWYARYHEQIEKSKFNNRNAEMEYVNERDTQVPTGQEWDRISRMCDFNPKASRGTKDTSRMRSIILQLKQTPLVHKSGAKV